MTNESDEAADDVPDSDDQALSATAFRAALESLGRPVATASGVARVREVSQTEASDALDALVDSGHLDRLDVSDDPRIWYPRAFADLVSPEHVVVFPDRRELVVEHPEQFTRAQLTQFAHLVDSSGDGAYIYEIREEDVWWAPYDHVDDLVRTMRGVLPERSPKLEEWVESQWRRARRFALTTHPDGYTILEAESPELMGNVARQKLDTDLLHGPISDTESWVVEGKEGEIKRALYDAGYPVQDQRELEGGADLDIDLRLELRDYQRDWVDRFLESGAGVLVGPPGSGKTVAAMGAMHEIGGETLVLAPSRELAGQWREALLTDTDLDPDQIGEYHGGEKNVRPVTIATYRTAGMERHRALFDEFRRGERTRLIVSRVGDEGIDLPNAELAIVASGLGGSRRQASQRAGRTMRPAGSSRLYVLATRGTREEEFARQQLSHLAGKGIRLTETEFEPE